MAVKRNNRKIMEYLLENGANPNISDDLGVTQLMIATFNFQLYNMAVLRFFNAQLGATCSSYEFDVFDIAEISVSYLPHNQIQHLSYSIVLSKIF